MPSAPKLACPSSESTLPATDVRRALENRAALDGAMSAEILELERHIEQVGQGQPRLLVASCLLAAAALRRQLNRVSEQSEVSGIPTFDQQLSESTLETYRWALALLSQVNDCVSARGQRFPQSSTPEALSVLHHLSRVCAASKELSRKRLADTLGGIEDAIHRLIDAADRIQRMVK